MGRPDIGGETTVRTARATRDIAGELVTQALELAPIGHAGRRLTRNDYRRVTTWPPRNLALSTGSEGQRQCGSALTAQATSVMLIR